MIAQLVLLIGVTLPVPFSAEEQGGIAGVVYNASQGNAPAGQSQVVLRLRRDGEFVAFRETTADMEGRFLFLHLPIGEVYEYLAGASRDGIHYPGPHIQLTAARPRVRIDLPVRDASAEPNPLVIRRQEIVVSTEPGAVRVTESMLIDNPSETTYVGPKTGPGEEPVTLQLAIPSNFERTTFDEEFFGRGFVLAGGRLVTGIPWPPGKRELKFTYVLPNRQRCFRWERPLDLPCDSIRVRVKTAKGEETTCSLEAGTAESESAVFESTNKPLPAGHAICLELGHLPTSWTAYARWLAAAILAMLVLATIWWTVRQHRRCPGSAGNASRKRAPSCRRAA